MANYATLKAAIQNVVKTNGNNEITGALLQQTLLTMVNSLGAGYQYMGVATPATNPGTPDQNVFYLASTAGTYANFGGLVLADGEIAILKYNGTWSKDSTGAASLEKVNQLQKETNGQFKGFSTKEEAYNKGVLAIFYDLPASAAGHDIAMLYFGINPANSKFYFAAQDLTENKRIGYQLSSNIYSPVPTDGVEEIVFPSLTGQEASYQISNVRILVDWKYFHAAPFINGNTSKITLSDCTTHLADYYYRQLSSLIADLNNKTDTIQNSLLPEDFTLNDISKRGLVECVKNVKVYVPSSLSGGEWHLQRIGYTTNRFYFGLADAVSGESFYVWKAYTIKPGSGIERMSGVLSNTFMEANGFGYFELDIDWSKVGDYTVFSNNEISVRVYPLSQVNKVEFLPSFNVVSGSITIDEGVRLCGKNSLPLILGTNSMLIVRSNTTLENIVFKYQGTGAITERQESEYIFTPLITEADLSAGNSATFFGNHGANNRAIYILMDAKNVHIVGCQFLNFDQTAVYDGGNRHKSDAHNSIYDCMFVNCRTGIWVSEEFPRIYGNYFFGCITGVALHVGDPNIYGNNFVRCDCAIYMDANQSAHGQIISCHFTHCGIAGLFAKTIVDASGMIISGCQFAQAPIIAEYSVGLRIDSCRLDTHFIISDGGKNSITNNNMRKVYATADGISNIFDVPSDTLISGNRALTLSESDEIYNRITP